MDRVLSVLARLMHTFKASAQIATHCSPVTCTKPGRSVIDHQKTIMNKQVGGAALGILLCAAGCGRDERPIAVAHLGPGRNRTTPEQKAAAEARNAQIGHLDKVALVALNAGQYVEAEAAARQSLSLGISSGRSQEYLAAALDAQGKAQEALHAYKGIADSGGVFPRNLLPYALLLLKTGQWTQAVAAYNKQLPYLANGGLMAANSQFSPIVPQSKELAVIIHIGLGLTEDWPGNRLGSGPRDQKLVQFRQALALAPDSALANYYYGAALMRLGRRAEAEVAFKKASGLDQGDIKHAAEEALRH